MWVLGFEPETSGRPITEPPLQHLRCYFKWKHFPNFCFRLFLAHEQRKALFSHFDLIPGNFTRFLISSSSCFMHSLVCFMHKIISFVHRVTCSLCKNISPLFSISFSIYLSQNTQDNKNYQWQKCSSLSLLIVHIGYGVRCGVSIHFLSCVEYLGFLQIHRLKK